MIKRTNVAGRTLVMVLAVGTLALGVLAGCTQNNASEDTKPSTAPTGSIGSHATGAKEGTAPAPGGGAPVQQTPDNRTAPKPKID